MFLGNKFLILVFRETGNAIRGVLGDPATWSTTARGSAPWQSHQLMNVFSYGNSSTDSSCALSLLSNSNLAQQEQQRLQTPTNTWRPSLDFDSVVADRVTMAQPPPVSIQNQYLNQTWEFMSGEKSNEHCISPALGLNQISEPVGFQISNGTTMGGFELSLHQQVLRQYLEPENTRAYDSSPQQFNWSL